MRPLPLNVQTLYADLAQSVSFERVRPGSVFSRTVSGRTYLYVTEKHGAARLKRYLGLAANPDVVAQAAEIRRSAVDAKLRRTTVSMLKRSGVPAPSLAMGRVLEALANTGLFRNGMVLVGTGAYQIYSALLGVALSHAALTTQDADLAAASLAVRSDIEGESLLDVLKRADPSFVAQPGLAPRDLPRRFRATSGFEVDLITRYRTRADDERAVPIPGLRCSAQALRYLEYLITEPISAIALYGSGVEVSVPQPARYAVHKLIVAQVRSESSAKRTKDLAQAKELIDTLDASDPDGLAEAIADARRLGAKWRMHIDRSLAQVGRKPLA